ncbi:hypothetical protein BgiBS90_012708 [Biomphalaria glabrata]|nr:hypothetical protein BgiBS90_012708 [Biomphalaria glabrata]
MPHQTLHTNIMLWIYLSIQRNCSALGTPNDDLIIQGNQLNITNCIAYFSANTSYSLTFCTYKLSESRIDIVPQKDEESQTKSSSLCLAARLYLRSGSNVLLFRYEGSCDQSQSHNCNQSSGEVECTNCSDKQQSIVTTKTHQLDSYSFVKLHVKYLNATLCPVCDPPTRARKWLTVDILVFLSLFFMCIILGYTYKQGWFCFKKEALAVESYSSASMTLATTATTATSSYQTSADSANTSHSTSETS